MSESNHSNLLLAKVLLATAVIAILSLFFFVLTAPASLFSFLSHVSAKLLAFGVGMLLIIVIGLLIYLFFHTPPPKRLYLALIRFFIIAGIVSGPVSHVTSFYVQSSELGITVSFGDAVWTAIGIFVVACIMSAYISRCYEDLCKWESQYGSLG